MTDILPTVKSSALRPYPAYKPSGVEWLGDVPEHWDLLPLSAVTQPKTDTYKEGLELLSVYLDRGVIKFKDAEERRTNPTSEDVSNYKVVDPGDFVLNNQQAWRGSVGVSKYKGVVSPAYLVLSLSSRLDLEFANLLFRDRSMVNQYLVSSRGVGTIQRNLYWPQLKKITTAVPPIDEQTAIVRYLDHTDDRIRRVISAKERLIELLSEQRQAVIHRAVTRGLDPNVQLKDSGAEWLGDLPAHWEVRRLAYLASKFGSGITPRGGATVYQETGIPFLRSQNIHFDGLRTANVAYISERMHNKLAASHVKPSDVLLNITGASIGRVCSVPTDFTEANVNQHVCIVRPRREHILSEFLSAYLSTPTIQSEIYIQQSGASREGLTLQSIRGFLIPVPPLAEQNAIAHCLDKATADIDTAIANTQRQIDLLREYRTRLIADVVTGQVDVREQDRLM